MASIPPIEVRLQLQVNELRSQIKSALGEIDKLRTAQGVGAGAVKAVTAEYQKQLESIKNQTGILQAQSAILQAQANIAANRAQKELAGARTVQERAAIERRLSQEALTALNTRQKQENALFNLKQQQLQLEAQIAVESAKGAVEKAKAAGATQGEIAALNFQVSLQEKNQAAIARSTALQREALQLTQKAAREQLAVTPGGGGNSLKILTAEYQKQFESIKNQTTVLQSQSAVLQSQANLAAVRSQKELAAAKTSQERAAIEQRQAQEALSALTSRQQKETALFNLKQQQLQIESQLAVSAAKTDLARAKAAGANKAELATLQQQVSLQEKNQAAIARSSDLQREALKINQQAAREQLSVTTSAQDVIAQQISAYQILGQVATQIFNAIRAAAGSVIAETAEFSRQLTTVGAINTTSSTESLKALSEEAIRLGTVTSKSPQQVAGAAVSLSRLGFTANQVNQNLSGLVLAAESTQGSVESAADVVGASVKIYGDFAKAPITAAKSADIFAATLNNTGVGSLDEFNQLLSKAGATGKSTGQDLVTLSTAFGVLRSAGFSAEVAGTALKTVLNSLSAPSTEAAAALNQLGVNTRDSATGEMKNLLDLLPEINDALANVAPQERDAITQAIFGARGGPAALTIMGQSRESLEALRATIDKNGTAAETAGKLVDKGFSGALVLFTSSVQTATLAIGQSLEPALEFVTRRGVDLLNIFIAIPTPIKAVAAGAAVLAAGLAGLTAATTAFLLVQKSGTIALVKEGAALLVTTAKKALYVAATGASATAVGAENAAKNLSILTLGKEAAATALATTSKIAYGTTSGGVIAAVKSQSGVLLASVAGFKAQAIAAIAAGGGLKAVGLAAAKALVPLALFVAAAFAVKNTWDIATAGLEQQNAFKDAAAGVDELNAATKSSEASSEAAARAAERATNAYGNQIGFLSLNTKAQLANQRAQFGLDKLLQSTNTTIDGTTGLLEQYGLLQVDAGDKARLGEKGIAEFTSAALTQKEAIEGSIAALEGQRENATTPEQTAQLDAQIAVLQKNKAALNERLAALGVSAQTETEVTDTLAATRDEIDKLTASYDAQIAALNQVNAAKKADVAEQQADGTLDEGQAAAANFAIEQDTLQQRLQANQAFQTQLRAIVAREGENTEAGRLAAQKLVAVETEAQTTRTSIAEAQIAERQRLEEEALTKISEAAATRLAAIEAQGQAETEATKRAVLEGSITREEAEQAATEQAARSAQARLGSINQEQAELKRALGQGTISREEYEARSTELAKQAGDARIAVLDAELAQQEAAQKAALDKIQSDRESGDAAIAKSVADRELAIQQQIASGAITEEQAAAKGLEARRAAAAEKENLARQELRAVEDAVRAGVLTEEEGSKRRRELELEVVNSQIETAKAAAAAREAVEKEAMDRIAKIRKDGEAAIAQTAADRELAVQQAILAGTITEEEAADKSAQTAKVLAAEKEALAKQELAALEDAVAKGLISEEEAAERRRALNLEVTNAQTDAIKAAIAAQEAAQRAAISRIEQASQRVISTLENQSAALGQQNSILEAQGSLLDALENQQKNRFAIAASLAGSELERAQIEQQAAQAAQDALAGRQAQELKILEIKQRQAALEAEIATRIAEANLAKAKASGASAEEIAALQEVVSLQRANEAAIAQSAELTRQATLVNQESAREQAAAEVELARRKVEAERVAAEDERIQLQRQIKDAGKDATPEQSAQRVREDIARTQQLVQSGAITQQQAAERLRAIDPGENEATAKALATALESALKAQATAPTTAPGGIPPAPPGVQTPAPGTDDLLNAIQQLNENLGRPNINIESVSPVDDLIQIQQQR